MGSMIDMSPVGAGGGGGAGVHLQAEEDLADVVLHRVEAAAEDEGDLLICLALGDPVQDLSLALGKAQPPDQKLDGGLWNDGGRR